MKKISFAGPSMTDLEVQYVTDAVKNGWYDKCYDYIRRLEKIVSEYVGCKYAYATFCATHALHAACVVLNLKPGDEVICTDFSWAATSYVIAYTGATPVFVDIDPYTWNIDPNRIEDAITNKTKAIMVVHSFGIPCDMTEIMRIANEYDLKVIEDAAPALGAEHKGKKVGCLGDIGCFSFHGAKIAVSGEGGILMTNDEDTYKRVKLLCDMGRTDSRATFWCDILGYEYTMSNVVAALACAQVERIEELVNHKRMIHSEYKKHLLGYHGARLLSESPGDKANYCYPSMILQAGTIGRDDLVSKLKEKNIHSRSAFPRMSNFPIFYPPRYPNPVATTVESNGISLPAAANMTAEDVKTVCDAIKYEIGDSYIRHLTDLGADE